MLPLNYAILKHLTNVEEACTDDVMLALQDQYGHFKAFNKKEVLNALMTAAANGLLEEKRFDLTKDNEVKVYFYAPEDGRTTINKYITC